MKISDEAIKGMMDDYEYLMEESFIYTFIRDNDSKIQKKIADGVSEVELDTFIKKRIKTFVYDLQNRSSNTALNIINGWYEHCEQADQSIKDYQTLFDMLSKSADSDRTLIPIMVNKSTGIGLYIVGKDNFAEDTFNQPPEYHCSITMINTWEQTDEYGVCLYGIGDEYFDQITFLDEPVKEAKAYFKEKMVVYKDNVFGDIREMNGNMPKGCPENLKMYFLDYESKESSKGVNQIANAVTKEAREKARQEFQQQI